MVEKQYTCPWDGEEFTREVSYVKGLGGSKKSAVSSQVRCPQCNNLIPTWKKVNGVKVRI